MDNLQANIELGYFISFLAMPVILAGIVNLLNEVLNG